MRRVRAVQFVRAIPVFETGRLQEFFCAGEHWVIETSDLGGAPWVRLSRPEVANKNVPAVKGFIVRGVGFAEPNEEMDAQQASVSRDGEGDAGACMDAAARSDGAGAAQAGAADPKPAQGGPKKASRRVKP